MNPSMNKKTLLKTSIPILQPMTSKNMNLNMNQSYKSKTKHSIQERLTSNPIKKLLLFAALHVNVPNHNDLFLPYKASPMKAPLPSPIRT